MEESKETSSLFTRRICDTAVWALIKRLWHCSGRSVPDSRCNYPDTSSLFVICSEEVGNERHIDDPLGHLWATSFLEWPCDLVELIRLAQPCDRIYMVVNWQYGVCNVDIEQRMRPIIGAS